MYKGQSGMWSWLLHRVTGLGILLFLFIHIVDVSLLGFGPLVYDEGIVLFDQIIVRLLSLALIGAVLFQRVMFIGVLVLTILVFLPMSYYVIVPGIPWLFHINTASNVSGH
ncbi:MAG: hypothetical protein NVSMB38_45410 [Ktedonobacteraceae bacterium]